MTKYFLFEYDAYYPSGGFWDLTGIFKSEDDALAVLKDKSGWDDNVDIYSLEDNGDKPRLLYNRFFVQDDNDIQLVIGNEEKRVIKLVGKYRRRIRLPYSSLTKMSDCKLEGNL